MLERVRNAARSAKALLEEAGVKTMDQIVSALSNREVDTSPRGTRSEAIEKQAPIAPKETEAMKEQGGPSKERPAAKEEKPAVQDQRAAVDESGAVRASGAKGGERAVVGGERATIEQKAGAPGEQAGVAPKAKRPPTPPPTSSTMMAQASPRPDPRIEVKTEHTPSKPEPDYGIFAALPQRYASHRLALIARDPRWGYVYWDVDRERGSALFEPGVQAVLRLLDANDGRVLMSPRVHAENGRYYFRLPSADQRYQVALIAVKADGHEVEVLRSNVVLAPPELPRPEREARFVSMRKQIAVLEQAREIHNPPRLVDEEARRLASYPTPSIAGQALTLLPSHEKPRAAPVEEGETGTPGRVSFDQLSDFRAILSGSEVVYVGTSSSELLKKKE
jgi:hypothetical protein